MAVPGIQERAILLPGQGGTVGHAGLITQLKLLTFEVRDSVIGIRRITLITERPKPAG
jgi:hypothetical protein